MFRSFFLISFSFFLLLSSSPFLSLLLFCKLGESALMRFSRFRADLPSFKLSIRLLVLAHLSSQPRRTEGAIIFLFLLAFCHIVPTWGTKRFYHRCTFYSRWTLWPTKPFLILFSAVFHEELQPKRIVPAKWPGKLASSHKNSERTFRLTYYFVPEIYFRKVVSIASATLDKTFAQNSYVD